MKTSILLITLISCIGVSYTVAQEVEHDDMYFTAKDRAKLREVQKANELVMASAKKTKKAEQAEEENLNPTDSYSARNVNPEYTSRANSQTARAEDDDYYVSNYQYQRTNNFDNWNNNFNNWYRGSWYSSNYWGPSINSWNSPYYGFYDSWNSPWYDPFWSYNGYSTSFSYHYGNSWNYGWGGSYNYWNRPYCAYNSYYGYGSGFGYGSNWYWNNYRAPQTVVIVNNGESAGKGISYGKRPTRGSSVVGNSSNDSRSRSSVVGAPGRGGNDRNETSGGRVRNPEYYNRTWRNSDPNNSINNTSTPSTINENRRTESNRPSYWNNNNNSSNSSSSPSWSAPSRSSNSSLGNSSGGGGTRTQSSTTGSGSGGRTRGRD